MLIAALPLLAVLRDGAADAAVSHGFAGADVGTWEPSVLFKDYAYGEEGGTGCYNDEGYEQCYKHFLYICAQI
jgi:hypothetical protein